MKRVEAEERRFKAEETREARRLEAEGEAKRHQAERE